MQRRLNDNDIRRLLAHDPVRDVNDMRVKTVDVFIAGSGPVACAYARTILEQITDSGLNVLMVEIGSQDNPIIGAHHKNSIKYQKDIDSFVNVIKGALQPVSVPPSDSFLSTLGGDAWRPAVNQTIVSSGSNPLQKPELNLGASAITRTVGGMATHWTCACPTPHVDERVNNPIPKEELDGLLSRAQALLNVHTDQYDQSIRHRVVKSALLDALQKGEGNPRKVQNLPLAVERRKDNPSYVTWSGSDTVLGDAVKDPRFALWSETRVTRLMPGLGSSSRVGAALVRDLRTNEDVLVIAKAFVIACGAVATPQILHNSPLIPRPEALGRYLSEQSIAFCQIVLKRQIVENISINPEFKEAVEKHQHKYPEDPLPIPFHDPEPQVMIPYSSDFPHHCQIHRDAFSYGDVGPRADPRVVVDLRFFGKQELDKENRVEFSEMIQPRSGEWRAGITDIYGMPQATFHVQRSQKDEKRDHVMMNDMTNVANVLGAFLPGSQPQFMEPGLAVHITGTIRIGTDTSTSVADPSSKVHGTNNLWVGGNGCIPDSTASNPTLTSVAIALKGAGAVVKYLEENKGAQK